MMLECRIPISPWPAWLNRTRLIAASIRQFYPNAIVRAYVGEPGGVKPHQKEMVTTALRGLGIEWIGAGEFDKWAGTRSQYIATMNRRFTTPAHGSHVLILDADVLMVRPIPELFEVDAIQGVQAHVAPVSDAEWRMLFRLFGVEAPLFGHAYSGNGFMGPLGRNGPFYPNSGMIFAPRHLFERLCEPYQQAIRFLRNVLPDTYWFDQLAVALAVVKADVPRQSLPPRFNFPNQRTFDEAYPGDLADIRVLHYLRTDTVDRDRDFEDAKALRRFTDRTDLTGSNEVLRARVADLLPTLDPEPLTQAEDAPWA